MIPLTSMFCLYPMLSGVSITKRMDIPLRNWYLAVICFWMRNAKLIGMKLNKENKIKLEKVMRRKTGDESITPIKGVIKS